MKTKRAAAIGRRPGAAAAPASVARLRLRITAAAERHVRAGHPWIFAKSIRDRNREGTAGEIAVIYDRKDQFLAAGLFDPASPIRVRVLHCGKPAAIDTAWWSERLAQAVARRERLFDERTTGYRVINGESDGWPGLVLDRYGATLVVKLYTAAWIPWLSEITAQIRARLSPGRLVLRLSRNLQELLPKDSFLQDGQILYGDRLDACPIFLENGLRFEANVVRGQKTGFFLDQRENRQWVGSLAQGRRVLNAFSFSGGFSLYAARGGARSVADLDISAHALASAERNFRLNSGVAPVAGCAREPIQADAFAWLQSGTDRRWDLIVLDPPSFAKREAERAGGIRAYERLSSLAIRRLCAGGILVSSSCSAHVTAQEFFEAVRGVASASGRSYSELQCTRHAPDHPAAFVEAEYLKTIYLRFEE